MGEAAGLEEDAAEFGVGHQAGVFVLFRTATGFVQPGLLQSLPGRFRQRLHADCAEPTGLTFFPIFFVAITQLLFDE